MHFKRIDRSDHYFDIVEGDAIRGSLGLSYLK